ncbi:MAG: hypothetical protein ACXWEI_21560 [Mycobacterium sp.]
MQQILSRRIARVAAAGAFIGVSTLGIATATAASDTAEPAEPKAAAAAASLAAPPEVFAGFDNFDALTGTSPRTNTVNVPAGSYSIIAKGFVSNPNNDNSAVRCRLTAGSDFDQSESSIRVSAQSIALAVVHTSSTPFQATLSCANLAAASNTRMDFIKIVATRVNAVTNNVM